MNGRVSYRRSLNVLPPGILDHQHLLLLFVVNRFVSCLSLSSSSSSSSFTHLPVCYKVVNKKVLNTLPAPLTVGSIQFGVGAIYASLMWLLHLRKAPKLYPAGKAAVRKIGYYHCFGQLLTIVSLGSGPVSFTHIVKALEPFFSALVSALIFGKWMKPLVYLSLVPVVAGVAYACLKEKFFSWLAFYTAMGSNLAFALRAVSSKAAMTNGIGENITSANLFGLVTWAAFLVSLPVALLMEGSTFIELWNQATQTMDPFRLGRSVVVSGLFHYLNNEVMYLALSSVHPVTLAVGNTMKRVFIMVASVMVFRNPVSVKAGIGSGVGIFGVLLYSLTKNYFETQERKELMTKKQRFKGAKALRSVVNNAKKVSNKAKSFELKKKVPR